jgi:hypothetical protein
MAACILMICYTSGVPERDRTKEEATMTATQLAELKQQSLQTFEQDLPQLLAQRPGQWIAYRGSHSLGFADEKHLLYQQCFNDGLQPEEFVVFCIEPQETEMTLGPMMLD